jgi:hypothetical protein
MLLKFVSAWGTYVGHNVAPDKADPKGPNANVLPLSIDRWRCCQPKSALPRLADLRCYFAWGCFAKKAIVRGLVLRHDQTLTEDAMTNLQNEANFCVWPEVA